jgi:branched-chain amino acid transport system permease protein
VTFDTLTMTMVGGLGTTVGPILGALLLKFLSESLRTLEDFFKMDIRLVIYGLLLILTIRFMRGGLVGVLSGIKERFGSYGKGRKGGGNRD